MTSYFRRTYEPLKFLGRLFWVPLEVTPHTPPISYSPTWEDSGEHWGPTLVVRIPLTRRAVGLGVWLDVDPDSVIEIHEDDAMYDAYVAVNGPMDRSQYDAARKTVAARGLDPDQEMEAMQMLGIME